MAAIARRVTDKRMLKLLRAFLESGVMENGLVSPVEEGTPQGGPLSPLLSNLVLDELDRELERRQHCFVRYAGDCNIYVASERAGKRVMHRVTGFIRRRLKLKVNEAKSAVARPQARKFLGFSFTGRAKTAHRAQSLAALQAKSAGTDAPDPGDQSRADDEGASRLLAWLEGLLRRLPDAFGAESSGSVDTAQAAIPDLAAMEAQPGTVSSTTATGSGPRPRRTNGGEPPLVLEAGKQSGAAVRAAGGLLRLARPPTLVRGIAQLLRTAVCGPACTVVFLWAAPARQ
jgi:hypothetical protein